MRRGVAVGQRSVRKRRASAGRDLHQIPEPGCARDRPVHRGVSSHDTAAGRQASEHLVEYVNPTTTDEDAVGTREFREAGRSLVVDNLDRHALSVGVAAYPLRVLGTPLHRDHLQSSGE